MIEYRRLADGRILARSKPSPALDASPRYERVEPLRRTPYTEGGPEAAEQKEEE